MSEKQLHVRVSEQEMKALDRYCKRTKRTKSDVIRELIRLLPNSGTSSPIVKLGVSMYPDTDS